MALRYIIYIALLLYFCIEPILNHFEYKRLRREPSHRIKYYYMTILGLWLPVALIILLIIIGGITRIDLGLNHIRLGAGPLHKWFAYFIVLLSLLYFLNLIYHTISMKVSGKYRAAYYAKVNQSQTSGTVVDIMLPASAKEKRIWKIISISAGVCEEILFRGFLMYTLSTIFPSLPIVVVILITSLVFGMWHIYQGLKGAFVTFMVGIFFSLLYVSVGSILPVMLLHIFMDLSAQDANTDGIAD